MRCYRSTGSPECGGRSEGLPHTSSVMEAALGSRFHDSFPSRGSLWCGFGVVCPVATGGGFYTRLLLEEKLSAKLTDEVLPQYGFAGMRQ